ncbi:MAG: homoserine dehydrogenase [Peptococcaceae bacterium]|nr:homoserine dehydrogenase [Peptococcaceae bacterium]
MREINIGLLGLGTVGSGVIKALQQNNHNISAKLNAELKVKRILVRELAKERAVKVDAGMLTGDFSAILDDTSISIIVEAMGGIEPAREYILQALGKGKHVVTANKEVVAKYGREILAVAEKMGVEVCFEASVGGGIPIIRPLKQCLAANEIQEIIGIINGTTNYILTKMATEGKDFAAILQEAQAKGYAEPDPTSDVDGYDAAYKLAILASLAFGTPVGFSDVKFTGIGHITREDMVWADKLGCVIKLLAVAKLQAQGLELRVEPCLVPQSHPLASVNDVFNGIYLKGNLVGEVLFTGRGAGDLPTASAVVADLMDVAQTILAARSARPACTCYRNLPVLDQHEIPAAFYLRVAVRKADAILSVNQIFNQSSIPVTVAGKKLKQHKGGSVVYIISDITYTALADVVAKLREAPGVADVSLFPLEGLCADDVVSAKV